MLALVPLVGYMCASFIEVVACMSDKTVLSPVSTARLASERERESEGEHASNARLYTLMYSA